MVRLLQDRACRELGAQFRGVTPSLRFEAAMQRLGEQGQRCRRNRREIGTQLPQVVTERQVRGLVKLAPEVGSGRDETPDGRGGRVLDRGLHSQAWNRRSISASTSLTLSFRGLAGSASISDAPSSTPSGPVPARYRACSASYMECQR